MQQMILAVLQEGLGLEYVSMLLDVAQLVAPVETVSQYHKFRQTQSQRLQHVRHLVDLFGLDPVAEQSLERGCMPRDVLLQIVQKLLTAGQHPANML
jgi:hypothetical protein